MTSLSSADMVIYLARYLARTRNERFVMKHDKLRTCCIWDQDSVSKRMGVVYVFTTCADTSTDDRGPAFRVVQKEYSVNLSDPQESQTSVQGWRAGESPELSSREWCAITIPGFQVVLQPISVACGSPLSAAVRSRRMRLLLQDCGRRG